MSFRGWGGSSLGGAGGGAGGGGGSGRGPGSRLSPVNRHGEELVQTIRDLIANYRDTEVNDALRRFYFNLQDDQRPSPTLVIESVAALVNFTGGVISPQQAILRMAGAGWDYQVAVGTYLAESEDGSSSSLSSPRGGERDGDPDTVEGPEEGDRRVRDDTEEPESWSADGLTAANRRNLAANPGIDRSVATKGNEDQSKLTITIRGPDGRPIKVNKYRGKVDFEDPGRVGALNRWRAQIFRRLFGGSRPYRQHFHELEKDWLLNEHIDFEQKRLAQGKPVDYSAMRWGDIADRFNRRFEGQRLPGVKTPRPSRTKVALRTERSRVKKITDHTGIPFRVQPRRGASKRGPLKPAKKIAEDKKGPSERTESEDDGEEEEEEEEEEWGGPRGTRRGDPPPGKKPWRKDGDDKDGEGGLSRPIRSSEIGV